MGKKQNVYKDSNGFYFKANLGKDPITGKRLTKTKRGFKTEAEAYRAYMVFMLNQTQAKDQVVSDSDSKENMTFKDFRDQIYLDWYKSRVKPNTFNPRKYCLLKDFKDFENKNMRDISVLDVQIFQNKLLSSGVCGSYINLLCSLMAGIWDRAKIFGFVEENPFRALGRIRVEKKKINFWTLDDFKVFEKSIFTTNLENKTMLQENLSQTEYYDFFHYLFYRFLFFTGLRFGESAALLWENVDLEEGKIKVLYTVGNRSKKKSEQYLSTPKSKSSERTLFIDNRTILLLKNWRFYQHRSGDIKLVFSHDDVFIDGAWMGVKFKRLQEKFGLPRATLHDLRHSHASLLIHMKENPKMVQERLGHAKIEMTLDIYSHLYPTENFDIVDRLNTISGRE